MSTHADKVKSAGADWLEAVKDVTDTALECWRDCLDARTPVDLQEMQVFYGAKFTKNGLRCAQALQEYWSDHLTEVMGGKPSREALRE